jgi:hypothetical protein
MGHYPAGTVFAAAERRLRQFQQAMIEFGRSR